MPKKVTEKKQTKKTVKKVAPKAEKSTKKTFVDKYKAHNKDTGSTVVQIAQLSDQINELANHLKKHTKDNDSRLGLLLKVGKRRKLLNYLLINDEAKYATLIKDLKLRK